MAYPKLRPCPVCNAETLLFGYEGWNGGISSWRVECEDCDYIGSCESRKRDAIRAHNLKALRAAPASPESLGVPQDAIESFPSLPPIATETEGR